MSKMSAESYRDQQHSGTEEEANSNIKQESSHVTRGVGGCGMKMKMGR